MILAFIIIALLIALVAIGNTEFKGAHHYAAPRSSPSPVNTPPRSTAPKHSAGRKESSVKPRANGNQKPARQAPSSSNGNDFVELPEEAYAYHGMDLGGMPIYDNSVSDDRFLNDPDDGMSKDSSGFDEEF